MSLNIKNERVHRLARAAAELAGTSQTSAIETALERYVAELETREAAQLEERRDRVRRRLERIHEHVQQVERALLSDDDLYDDAGLPR